MLVIIYTSETKIYIYIYINFNLLIKKAMELHNYVIKYIYLKTAQNKYCILLITKMLEIKKLHRKKYKRCIDMI